MCKKILVLCFVICFFVSMIGCNAENKPYRIIYDDDGCRIELGEELQKELSFQNAVNNTIGCEMIWEIHFETLSEMKRRFTEADLSEDELWIVCRFLKDDNGNIIIPDLDDLYEPVLPESATTFGGASIAENTSCGYYFSLKFDADADMSQGTFWCCLSDDDLAKSFERNYLSVLYNDYRIKSQTYDEERDADVYVYDAHGREKKAITYSVTTDTGIYWVEERYYPAANDVPDQIYIFCDTDTSDFLVWINEINERPSVEFLTSFGVAPFEES